MTFFKNNQSSFKLIIIWVMHHPNNGEHISKFIFSNLNNIFLFMQWSKGQSDERNKNVY